MASALDEVSAAGARVVAAVLPELVDEVDGAVVVGELVVDAEFVGVAKFVGVAATVVAELSALLVDVELLVPEVLSSHATSMSGMAKQKTAL